MPDDPKESQQRQYDLEERTARFGEAVIRFAKELPITDITRPLISQLVRSATSIGANYCEADGAASKKDFMFRIGICKRESRETMHWLRMIVAATDVAPLAREHWREAKELQLIFAATQRSSRKKP